MTQEDMKINLLSPAQWLRMVIMVGYLLVLWVLAHVLLLVVLVQTLIVLVAGQPNIDLKNFGTRAVAYLYQIVNFLVYGTDRKPFPFAPFPETADDLTAADPSTIVVPEQEELDLSEAGMSGSIADADDPDLK